MTLPVPDLICEIAFTTDPLSTSPSWTDVSGYVRHVGGVQIQRGRPSELADFQPGSCTLTLNNRDRRFDPRHTTGPYFGNLKPGKAIRLRARWASVNYPLFVGFIESWPQSYEDGNRDATVTLECFDGLSVLAEMIQPDPVLDDTLSTIGSCELFLRNCDGQTWFDESGYGRNAVRVRDGTFAAWRAVEFVKPKKFVPVPLVPDTYALFSMAQSGTSLQPGLMSSSVSGGRWLFPTLPTMTSYTVAFWFTCTMHQDEPVVKPSTYEYVTQMFGDWTYSGTATGHAGQIAIEDQTDNNIHGDLTGSSVGSLLHGPTFYNDGGAHHVALTVTPTETLLYVDGVAVASGTGGTTALDCTTVDMTLYKATTGPAAFLPVAPPTSATTMQDVTVFSKTLSAVEVLRLYQEGAGELPEATSTRISRLVANTDWPTAWVSTLATLRGICVEHIPAFRGTTELFAAVTATEQGRLFVDASGVLQFLGRYYQSEVTAGRTSQATFADDNTGVPYRQIATDYSTRDIQNEITVGATGGVTGSASDATSIAAYRRQPASISTLLPGSTEATDMAAALVAMRKDAVTRLSAPLQVRPARKTANWPTVLGLEIGHRVTLKLTPMRTVGSQISQQMSIEGIEWDITVDDWHVGFDLAPIPVESGTTSWFILDDSTFGVLGDDRLGY